MTAPEGLGWWDRLRWHILITLGWPLVWLFHPLAALEMLWWVATGRHGDPPDADEGS